MIAKGKARYETYFGILDKTKGNAVILDIYGDKNRSGRFEAGIDRFMGKARGQAVATFPAYSGSFKIDVETSIARASSIGGYV